MITLKTIKDITEQLKAVEEPELWMEELELDSRTGVQNALNRWKRRYEKRKVTEQTHAAKEAFDASYASFDEAMIAGVDEAGRGPLAGPVVTAAVILPRETPELVGLDDSKTIAKAERERLAEKIRSVAISYSAHIQSAKTIDEMNIYAATRDSMEQAVKGLSIRPDFVIVDAMSLNVNCPTESVIKGDAKSLAIAAASIIAKTTRDAIMDEIHNEFPVYKFNKNAGYGTSEHVLALQIHGPSEHHRASFEPVKSMLKERRKDE